MFDIQVKDLTFAYSHQLALEDINFSLKQGFISVIGPNGAGKSTLVKVLNGSYKPKSGNVEVLNQNVHQLNSLERARILTTIHQQPHFSFPYTCMEMVGHGRYAQSKNYKYLSEEDYRIIVHVMAQTDTLQFKDKLITQLSGGEQQRVILATALAQEPRILFIDEGFSALDIQYKTRMIRLLKERTDREDLTVISIIHDLNIAYAVSDQVILMNKGKVIQVDHPDQVMQHENLERLYGIEFQQDITRSFQIKI